jgi:hypothetical protein
MTGSGGKLPNTGWNYPLPGTLSAANFTGAFKSAVYSTENTAGNPDPGVPANLSPNALPSSPTTNWANVEIMQVVDNTGTNYFQTLSINKTVIFTYTNKTAFTNGTLMLGYEDLYNDVGAPDAAAYFSNLRVVQLGPPSIVSAGSVGANQVAVNFTSADAEDTAASFVLQSTASLAAPIHWTDVSPAATFTQSLTTGVFTATTTRDVAVPDQFYRVRHK